MTTVLSVRGRADLDARAVGDDLWVEAADLEGALGWELKPEGLCQGEVCVPIPPAKASHMLDGDQVNAAAFWRHLGQPVVRTDDGSHWYLGEGAAARRQQLESLQAPDFTLPDKDG